MKLSELELDVMQLLWQQEPCTAAQLHELLSKNRKVAYTTVKTIVDRLEQKARWFGPVSRGRRSFIVPASTKVLCQIKPLLVLCKDSLVAIPEV